MDIISAAEQQCMSAHTLAAIIKAKIHESVQNGSASAQIILPAGYDEHAVDEIITDLRAKLYNVKWYHGTDCLEISWKWDDVMNSKKQ